MPIYDDLKYVISHVFQDNFPKHSLLPQLECMVMEFCKENVSFHMHTISKYLFMCKSPARGKNGLTLLYHRFAQMFLTLVKGLDN